MEYISYDEFKKMDIRVGTIRSVEPIEGADKLLKFMIDFGLDDTEVLSGKETETITTEGEEPIEKPKLRQILSGIREFYPEYEQLVGKQALYIINLEPRIIRGLESQGMLMAVDGKNGAPVFLVPEREVNTGSKVR